MPMELPYHLKTLEPLTGALDILRFLRNEPDMLAPVDTLLDTLELSERAFGKAIRRLVTQGYVQMDAEAVYRLTDNGRRAADELTEYETTMGESATGVHTTNDFGITGRVVLAIPEVLTDAKPVELYVGAALDSDSSLQGPTDILVRISALNAEPGHTQDAVLTLLDQPVRHTFTITPQGFDKVRVRVQVYQLLGDGEEIVPCGGFHADLPVTTTGADGRRVAFGSPVALKDN
jgi:predicted transcriptional regulator